MEAPRPALIALAILVPLAIVAGLFLGRGLASPDDRAAVPEPSATTAPASATTPQPVEAISNAAAGSDEITARRTIVANPPLPQPDEAPTNNDLRLAETFVDAFAQAHAEGDLGFLLGTLHPEVYASFDAQTCAEYVQQTMGSIQDMTVVGVGEPTTYELQRSGNDPLVFENAVPVAAEWTIAQSGLIQPVIFHLVDHDNTLRWLTTCGA